ncbi:glycosyltransferase [bacterium]|nr:glycosyltransferase [bacterium]
MRNIPKRIFYSWGINEPIKKDAAKCMLTWYDKLSNYEIIEINENSVEYFNFKKELKENKWFSEVYKRKMYAYVSDYIRVKVLYEHGGIYLDTDVSVLQNFDDILEAPCFVGLHSTIEGENLLEPAILGAQKNNTFIKKALDFYDESIWKEHVYIIPQIFKLILENKYGNFECLPKNKQEIVKYDDIWIYPESYFVPFHSNQLFTFKCIEDNTHTIHWFNGSWCKDDIFYFLDNKHRIPLNKIDEAYKKHLLWKKRQSENVNYSDKNINLIQRIFSIKNSANKKHKIIRLLGFKIKIKRGNI